jgi:hypothetical protein
MNIQYDQPIPEAAVLSTLTSEGNYPVESCFVLRKSMYRWVPNSRLWQGFMIDNPALADACRSFLTAQGRHFTTRDELLIWAREHNWEGWERLQPSNS